ncbi:MAG: DUF2312 domain-containing protein [Rhodobiaceae bacterium]|nr:DUF2312 domain-containing protein [Rhodobiaceae bacterium]MCC0055884.1 DUF2312 domain-containing protein [Rhodobiaceae bacterium]
MIAKDQLRAFVERIERLDEEKKAIADDIKDVYGEAKAMGYDTKVLRQLIRLRKQEPHERQEQQAILDVYMNALGMLPLFEHAEAAPQVKTVDEHIAELKAAAIGSVEDDAPAKAAREKPSPKSTKSTKPKAPRAAAPVDEYVLP